MVDEERGSSEETSRKVRCKWSIILIASISLLSVTIVVLVILAILHTQGLFLTQKRCIEFIPVTVTNIDVQNETGGAQDIAQDQEESAQVSNVQDLKSCRQVQVKVEPHKKVQTDKEPSKAEV
jgi:preprotein translocase subunit SecF